MINQLFWLSASIFLFSILNACSNVPVQSTRGSAAKLVVQPDAGLSELSRRFRDETPFTVNFAFDRDELDDAARRQLDAQAAWILSHPKVRFKVNGHTDKVGNVAYNMALGMRRASNVVRFLTDQGIDPSRLVAMVSFGEEHPLIDTEEREQVNRRTTTDVYEFVLNVARDRDDDRDDPVRVVVLRNDTSEGSGNSPQNDGLPGSTGGSSDPQSGGPSETPADSPPDNGSDQPPENGPADNQPPNGGDQPPAGGPTDTPPDNGSDQPPVDSPSDNPPGNGGSQPPAGGPTDNPPGGGKPSDHTDAGRGNGSEEGDPGNSEGHNNGGDELPTEV